MLSKQESSEEDWDCVYILLRIALMCRRQFEVEYIYGKLHSTCNLLSKHLACYFKGTAEYGIFLTSCSAGTRLQDHWSVKDFALEDPAHYNVKCYCDSNWGGCKTSRKSTSSGMVFLNGCLVLSLCKSQSTIALCSCEAELLAVTHMTAEAIMVCNLCRFLLKLEDREVNSDLDFIVYTDSSSAKALAQRRGVGRLKHVDLRHLWVQAYVRQKLIRLKKSGHTKQCC